MDSNQMSIAGIFILILFLLFIGFIGGGVGSFVGKGITRREAVRMGVAEYTADASGASKFVWIGTNSVNK